MLDVVIFRLPRTACVKQSVPKKVLCHVMLLGRVPASGVGLQVRHVHPGEETTAGGEVT